MPIVFFLLNVKHLQWKAVARGSPGGCSDISIPEIVEPDTVSVDGEITFPVAVVVGA